jgi:hypothetical protein
MTVTKYVNDNYDNICKWLYNVTKGERPDLFNDFVHEVIVIFLEHDKAKDVVLQGDARWFIVRIGLNQWRSSSSPFHKQYRPPHNELLTDLILEDQEYDMDIDIIQDLAVQVLDEMHMGNLEEYYMSLVVMIYHTLSYNFSEMERQLDIPRTSLSKVYTKAIQTVKTRLALKIEQVKNGTINVNRDRNLIYDRWSLLCHRASVKANAVHTEAVKNGILRDDEV